ncbi:MAG TPA: hypothetical protein DCR55_09050 [Lentisphaeria bacterium]|nr:hypothetical protein [Lentisphaeria bacterium]
MTKSTSTDAPTHVLRGILVPIDWDGDQVRTLALETDGEGEYLLELGVSGASMPRHLCFAVEVTGRLALEDDGRAVLVVDHYRLLGRVVPQLFENS